MMMYVYLITDLKNEYTRLILLNLNEEKTTLFNISKRVFVT